jgi:hypothetical protein
MNITLNVDNTLGYSFINGRLKVFVNKGTVSQSQSQSQESNTSDNQGRIIYAEQVNELNQFTDISDTALNNRYIFKITTYDNKTGEVSINTKYEKKILGETTYLDGVFDYPKTSNPKNISITKKAKAKLVGDTWEVTEKGSVSF